MRKVYSAEPQILDDSDEDFDPKTEDINQYCKIIGLDPEKEPDLLWIAKEGILAKLEPPWKAINQEDVGLYYFNFDTGDSMWEHPNDQHYRQKVVRERDRRNKHKSPKINNFLNEAPIPSAIRPEHASEAEMRETSSSLADCGFQRFLKHDSDCNSNNSSETIQNSLESQSTRKSEISDVQSPRLAPLRTPRSQTDNSISNSLDFLKSSNDSSKMNLGKKAVLGSQSEHITDTSESDSDAESNIQIDIGDLQPVQKLPSGEKSPSVGIGSDPKIDESISLSDTKDSDSSFKTSGNKFLKGIMSHSQKYDLDESSVGSKSASSKSTKSKSSSLRPKSGKIVPKINPTNASKLPDTISVQIEQKKKQTDFEIEEEMKKIQLELLEKRQQRYEEIMEAHETEMYRMEREAQKINTDQEKIKQSKLTDLRAEFESEINEAVKREQEQHDMTKSSAISGLKESLEQQKKEVLAQEDEKLKSELESYKLGIIRKNNQKIKEMRDEITKEENIKLEKLNQELLAKKHENERLINQDKEMFDTLRHERSKIEEQHKHELLKLQEEHNSKKQKLMNRNNLEIREAEKVHLNKMKDLHLKFESELNEKKTFLESKRKEFDTKIEKWERGHNQRKMAWAENSMRRTTELEIEIAKKTNSPKTTPNQSFDSTDKETPVLTRADLDNSNSSPKLSQTKQVPASERLREYLKGLEKKLETVSTIVDGGHAERWKTEKPSLLTNSAQPDYVSERWKAYFGQDFKYVPAKHELEQRTLNDYRYKQTGIEKTNKLREIIRTSSY